MRIAAHGDGRDYLTGSRVNYGHRIVGLVQYYECGEGVGSPLPATANRRATENGTRTGRNAEILDRRFYSGRTIMGA